MTNLQRQTETGTATFQPSSGIIGDVFSIARPPVQAPNADQLSGARFSVNPVGKAYPNLYHYIIEIYDARGPIQQEGRFDFVHNSAREIVGGDSRFKEVVTNAFLTYSASTPAPPSTSGATTIFHTYFGNQVVWSLQNQSDVQLVTEVGAANSAPQAITYSHPAQLISGLNTIAMNGIDYVAVQYHGQPVELLSDLTVAGPTVAGSMGVLTSGTYGIQQTDLPDRPLVIHAGATLYTLASNVAINTAPTSAWTNVPVGGYLVGMQGLGGGTPYIWWNWPRFIGGLSFPYVGSGVIGALNTDYVGKVVRCDMFGQSVVELDTPFANVIHTNIIRDGLMAGDFDRLWFTNGRIRKDLKVFRDEPVDSSRVRKIVNSWTPNKQELIVEINECDTSGSGSNTTTWKRRYDFDLDTWSDISARVEPPTIGARGIQSMIGAGPLPTSPLTGYLHGGFGVDSAFRWLRKWEPPPGVNPWGFRNTGTTGTGKEYESSVVFKPTEFDIPGLEGYPKTVTRVIGPPMSHITAGGSNAYMTVNVAGKTSKFSVGQTTSRYPIDERNGSGNYISTFDVTVTGYQQVGGTDATKMALNLLPITIEGYCLKDPDMPPGDWRNIRR